MGSVPTHEQLAAAVRTLIDTVSPAPDVPDLLHCLAAAHVELVDVDTAIVQIADERGRLDTVATCVRRADRGYPFGRELLDGPGAESFRGNVVVTSDDLELENGRWPTFIPKARDLGFRSLSTLPITARGRTLGSLTLLRTEPGALHRTALDTAAALVAVSAMTLLQVRAERSHARVRDQLQAALDSRVIIEQAKGYLARTHDESPDESFHRLHRHARSHRRRVADVAADVIARRLRL
ncbi:MAG: transcriptional regulator [Actinomycetospora sp.]|nr:transcriptional regulator [Actinomycetospora sp.]